MPIELNLDPASLTSTELKNGFAILSNLPLDKFNTVKRVLNLTIPDVLGPTTLSTFLRFCLNSGIDLSSAGVRRFKAAHPPLNPDLPIGPNTADVYYTALRFDTPNPLDCPWLDFAKGELASRVREFPGDADNPRIVQYNKSTTLPFGMRNNDETAWCSSFVNWCMMKADIKRTKSALARSWENWGDKLNVPRHGCVVVLKRGDPPKGHVGFFLEKDGSKIVLLGGNQGDAVSVREFDEGNLLSYRWPKDSDRL